VVVDAFVVFQATVDLPRLPTTLVIEDIGEFLEAALVELDPSLSAVGSLRRSA